MARIIMPGMEDPGIIIVETPLAGVSQYIRELRTDVRTGLDLSGKFDRRIDE